MQQAIQEKITIRLRHWNVYNSALAQAETPTPVRSEDVSAIVTNAHSNLTTCSRAQSQNQARPFQQPLVVGGKLINNDKAKAARVLCNMHLMKSIDEDDATSRRELDAANALLEMNGGHRDKEALPGDRRRA
jgi:hypothetical protein